MFSDEDIFEELNYGNNFERLTQRRKREKRYIAIGCSVLVLTLLSIFFLNR